MPVHPAPRTHLGFRRRVVRTGAHVARGNVVRPQNGRDLRLAADGQFSLTCWPHDVYVGAGTTGSESVAARAPPEALKSSFRNRCLGVERLIRLRAELERQLNIQNFDAGPGIEDIFREELDRLLPDRYAVRPGVVSNREGLNGGDCDVVIFNHLWFPSIKAGATALSRRFHYPVEGVYAVLEIKQSLTSASLDAAMEKLVMVSRLAPEPSGTLMVENRGIVQDGPGPPMFTAVVCAGFGSW